MKTVLYRPQNGGVKLPNVLILSGNGYRVTLKAGSNHLQEDALKRLTSHDSFQRYSSTKALEILEPVEEVAVSEDVPVDLTSYNVDDAEVIIEGEWNTETLNKWRSRDTRKGIFAAIDQRLERIKNGNG